MDDNENKRWEEVIASTEQMLAELKETYEQLEGLETSLEPVIKKLDSINDAIQDVLKKKKP